MHLLRVGLDEKSRILHLIPIVYNCLSKLLCSGIQVPSPKASPITWRLTCGKTFKFSALLVSV